MLPERDVRIDIPNTLEQNVLRCFGWTVVAYEDTLFERFLHLSSMTSVISLEGFKHLLRKMESKGYLEPIDLHGRHAYRRLIIDDHLTPQRPIDEMKLALGSRRAIKKLRPLVPPKITPELLAESQSTVYRFLGELERCLQREYIGRRISKSTLSLYLERMCKALTKSEDSFYDFLSITAPSILARAKTVVNTRGSEFMLLGLRIVDTEMRKYR